MPGIRDWRDRMRAATAAFSERRARAVARRDAAYTSYEEDEAAADTQPPPAPRAPDPAGAVPWGVRVAAEAGWRLLVLAATLWVLMQVISAVRLVFLAFAVALLVTALLQPTVARLNRRGLSRGLATAVTAVGGFLVLGLAGWFVVWQVMDNLGGITSRVEDGVDQLKRWLVHSPLHVTEQQINDLTKRLSHSLGTSAEEFTSKGLRG